MVKHVALPMPMARAPSKYRLLPWARHSAYMYTHVPRQRGCASAPRQQACTLKGADARAHEWLTRSRLMCKPYVSNRAAKVRARGKSPDGENVVCESKNMGSFLTSMFGVTFEKGDVTDSSAQHVQQQSNRMQLAQSMSETLWRHRAPRTLPIALPTAPQVQAIRASTVAAN